MLFKIDHLALTTSDVNQNRSVLKALGYQEVFSQKAWPNPMIKREFSKTWVTNHAIYYFEKSGSLPIEIVEVAGTHLGQGGFVPVIEGNLERLPEEIKTSLRDPQLGWSFEPGNSETADFQIKKIIVYSQQIEKSSEFFKSLGFRPVVDGNLEQLQFRPLMGGETFYFELRPAQATTAFLDTRGFNCLALVAGKLEREQIKWKSYETCSRIEKISVNNKDLEVLFLRGPGQELVEVIHFCG